MVHRYLQGLKPNTVGGVVFVICATAWAALIWYSEIDRLHNYRNQVTSHATIHAHELESNINRALSATYALAALVKQGRGDIADFETVGREMLVMYPGVSSLALSPRGVISKMAPLAGNEKVIGFNPLNDPSQGRDALLAKESGTLILAGPFSLVQGGGQGLVARLPVFIKKTDSASIPTFWGFTGVVIRLPVILASSQLPSLVSDGLNYELWQTDPTGGIKKLIVRSFSGSLVEAVNVPISLPNGAWELSVAPIRGWRDPVGLTIKSMVGFFLSLLLAYVGKLHAESKLHEVELEKQVAERTAEILASKEQLRIAATAFESHEGILVTDANGIIIKVNQAFTRITGYEEAEIIGKTPVLLKSWRHDNTFYQAMWADINRDYCWQGEIWNKRKNGEIYPEWLSITAVTDESGQVINYIGAFSDITEYKQKEQTIYNLAFYDGLTGLPNRQLMRDRLKQAMLSSAENNDRGALLFIDLDKFKLLNDTKGHKIGDQLLIEVAKRIRSCLHADDTIARLGSDEFAAIIDKLSLETDLAAMQVRKVAEKIQRAIRQPFDLDGHEYHCKACIGINLFQGHEDAMEEVLKRVDLAISQAKSTGSDIIHFFDSAMQNALEERVLLESWLRNAIPQQFMLYFQGQADGQGVFYGAEVLIRWPHPERGMISPAKFIPVAEDSGLILSVGQWVLETACLQLKAWQGNSATKHLALAVNVSPKQFQQPDFVDQVLDILNDTGADPAKLKLELTEGMLVDDVDGIIAKMNALLAIGVRFSLDDFGTGFSSLSYLKRLPLHQLKIDQSFVRDLLDDNNSAAIVRTIIALGHSLGLDVIAEGVETDGQVGFLSQFGCTNYQGYMFCRPVPLREFEQMMESQSTLV